MTNEIKTIGISGAITLNTHDLNNEGNEGNITIERQSTVVKDGNLITVNAISGDMLKHSVAQYINEIAKSEGLDLCAGCKVNHANRINMEEKTKLQNGKKKLSDEELSDRIIQLCVGDDLNGIMITETAIGNIHRKSCYETGVVNGIPDKVYTDREFHVKFSKESGKKGDDADGSNVGQNIFYRPNNSGEYATLMFVNAEHIGRNEYTLEYAIDEEERKKRLKVLISAIISTYTNIQGAQRNTMLPHITDFKGTVSISRKNIPAPIVSALNENYLEELRSIAENINSISTDAIELREFNSLSEFTQVMASLI